MQFCKSPRLAVWFSCLILLSLTAAVTIGAQEGQANVPPNIEIIKIKWEKDMRFPQNYDPSNGGANGTINDSATSSRSGSGGGSGGGGGAGSTTQGMQPSTPSRVSFVYAYSMKIRNHGSKEIEGVAWDYIFLDPSTSAELARHQFLSFDKVEPEKTTTFQSQQRKPPVRIIPGQEGNKSKFSEKGLIRCVLFSDGTTWREPNTAEDVCELLKKGKAGLTLKH